MMPCLDPILQLKVRVRLRPSFATSFGKPKSRPLPSRNGSLTPPRATGAKKEHRGGAVAVASSLLSRPQSPQGDVG